MDLNAKKFSTNLAVTLSLSVDTSCILDVHDPDKVYLFNP